MRLLISRPSVFVWGPEACLSNGLRRFRGNARPLRTKTVFAVASIYYHYLTCNHESEPGHDRPNHTDVLAFVGCCETSDVEPGRCGTLIDLLHSQVTLSWQPR